MKKLIAALIRFVPRVYLQRIGGAGLKLLAVFYAGNGVECPVCGKRYKKFFPYGRLKSRPNALCPNCLALERHRLIWLYLKEETNFFSKELDVLHVAPEACFIKRMEKQHGQRYITADIESPLAKVKMDIHEIPFPENSFDAVLCNHVLEHVDDDIKALTEIKRVLKPGGFAIVQVPFFHPIPDKTWEDKTITDIKEREKLFGQADHVRRYGKDYANRIEQAGLNAVEDQFTNTISEEKRIRYAIVRGETIYVAIKPA